MLGALFILLTAQIYIPVPGSRPVTGQTFGVLARRRRARLPPRRSRASRCTSCSASSGCRSSPRARAGSAVILGATGGYLVGFVVAGAVVGRLAELGWDRRIVGALGAMLIGSVVDLRDRRAVADGRRCTSTLADAIAEGLTPFLVWDAVKLVVAAAHLPDRLVARRPAPGRPLGD